MPGSKKATETTTSSKAPKGSSAVDAKKRRKTPPGPLANGRRVVLNLINDEEFSNVIELGLAEYIGRYKRPASTKSILPEALCYLLSFSGDEVWQRIFDKYTYDQQKRQGVNLTPELNTSLEDAVDKLRENTRDSFIQYKWNKRTVGVAALYLYCLYLIVHNGNKYVIPPEQVGEFVTDGALAV
ncbi:hypothetical protein [Asticcacaulis sp. W401b]|uniref:hypothetical protein n=1 Tax=Asticcacaulis sp. W401b TaxID=3388666 RepID=UPI003970BA83